MHKVMSVQSLNDFAFILYSLGTDYSTSLVRMHVRGIVAALYNVIPSLYYVVAVVDTSCPACRPAKLRVLLSTRMVLLFVKWVNTIMH